jgi:K+-transporting ATPase ATPase C chain
VLTGVIYPVVVTAFAQLFYANKANGSLIHDAKGQPIGSVLIGQSFNNPKYFWGRPSATAPYPYNAAASSGSNLGPMNPALLDTVKARIQALEALEPDNEAVVPVDLITASGSGLDPHISLAAVNYQLNRIAKARHIAVSDVQKLIAEHTETRQWFLLGEPRVNVLPLNLALDSIH